MIDFLSDRIAMPLAMIFVAGLFLFIISAVVFIIPAAIKHRAHLMEQCVADGRAEYECYAMLKDNSQVAIIPVK